MTNKPKQIGTSAEVAVCDFLRRAGYAPERIALAGVLDRGDIHYRSPRTGELRIVSVKGGKMAEQASPERIRKWLEELEDQADRCDPEADRYLVTKRAGIGAPRAELWRAHSLHVPTVGVWSADLADMARWLA